MGWVENRNDGVLIHLEGEEHIISRFEKNIPLEAPAAANIHSIRRIRTENRNYKEFKIVNSRNISDEITEVSPDIAVCEACLNDMNNQPHRIDYPFINCTNCGPRFTIIKDLPYDRDKTTMASFEMCHICKKEYINVMDRRFHAQPVACNSCGPMYSIEYDGSVETDIYKILDILKHKIESGSIAAIKGLGGFHLACDAQNQNAVARLRLAKNRDGKPFAVMFRDIDSLRKYACVSNVEMELLTGWRKPIVLLQTREKLADGVSAGFNTVGAMLPYMPFHHLLMQRLSIPVIVLTSGNISDEPIIIHNHEAREILLPVSDMLVTYNRDIHNRTDDSVSRIINGTERIIRRSRGYVPNPIRLSLNADGILAAGAELVNCFCIGKGSQAIMSQHIGDLKNLETLEFYKESFEHFKKLFRVSPEMIVRDLHPDYLSSKYADETGLKTISVQHHHAHITSVMAEYGLDEKVIGIAFDGTGLGDDEAIWGGEFFVCDLNEYERMNHFRYVSMPGGDKATEEPWRMAVSYLYDVFGEGFREMPLPLLDFVSDEHVQIILNAIEKKINCPLTSSAGRLFDAIAALLNIVLYSEFHAEAPMRLEAIASENINNSYSYTVTGQEIDFTPMIKEIIRDIEKGTDNGIVSAKFHNTIINVIFAVAKEIGKRSGLKKVVLSGGSFQNKYILENIEKRFEGSGMKLFIPAKVPVNDGGIALGQLVIAAKRRELKCV